ncbi:MAG: hypothetical protein M1308_06955 [Actinobacteria bacterium]|nr:hypothetical protein [Actinomycetota bacterium]
MAENFKKSRRILEKEDIFKKWIEITMPFMEDETENPNKNRTIKVKKIFNLEEQIKSIS